jgi:hypothetical protein
MLVPRRGCGKKVTVDTTATASFAEQVADATLEAFRADGFVKTNEDGSEERDLKKFAETVYAIVVQARVTTRAEKVDKAITKGKLQHTVLPSIPDEGTEAWDEADEATQKGRANALQTVWNEVKDAHVGRIQRMLGTNRTGLTLCKATVSIDGNPVEAVYVTDVEELILADYVKPRKDAIRKAADKFAKDLAGVTDRNPDMTDVLKGELDAGMKAASQLARATLELTSGK